MPFFYEREQGKQINLEDVEWKMIPLKLRVPLASWKNLHVFPGRTQE